MPVLHPRALESAPAGPPGGVTVDGTTYSVAADGVIDCPGGVEDSVAETLADCYGVDVEQLDPTADYDEDNETVPDNDGSADPDYTRDALEEMNKEDLLEIAQDVDLDGRSSMNKDELIDELTEE